MKYNPYERGPLAVATESVAVRDDARGATLPATVWHPAAAGGRTPLIVYSHSSGGDRNAATFLHEHLASHGYVVAALDHADRVLAAPTDLEERIRWLIANRVPDVRLLLDHVGADGDVGLVGHSFGGWTVLATPDADARVASIVALAPAGATNPRPGIIPATLSFDWQREVPLLVVAGDCDVAVPLDRVRDVYERAPEPKRLVVLRGADHMHFVDDVADAHEQFRALPAEGDLAWIAEMRPIEELLAPEAALRTVRGLTLAHFDATLRHDEEARKWLTAAGTSARR